MSTLTDLIDFRKVGGGPKAGGRGLLILYNTLVGGALALNQSSVWWCGVGNTELDFVIDARTS